MKGCLLGFSAVLLGLLNSSWSESFANPAVFLVDGHPDAINQFVEVGTVPN